MSTISQRLKRLEQLRGYGAGRMIFVSSHGAGTGEVQSLLRAKSVDVSPSDEVVHFSTIYEDRDGNPTPSTIPAQLLSITYSDGRHEQY